MTKKYSTKKALVASVLSLALCFSMLIGTTFAWFTDSVTSAGNIIKTGNLDVEMYWADGTQAVPSNENDWTDASTGAIFNYDNWEPGYVDVKHVQIKNNGTLALKYQVKIMANGEVSDDALDAVAGGGIFGCGDDEDKEEEKKEDNNPNPVYKKCGYEVIPYMEMKK